VVVGGCNVAAYWHVMLALPITATLVWRVRPLPATAVLSCTCALGTCEPSCTAEAATSSFTLEAHGPQSAAEHVTAPEPYSAGRQVRSRGACGSTRVLLSGEVGSRATGHVAAPEPSLVGRWGLELPDMWQHRSPPQQGGGV
jgi:hypothetical protein